MNSQITTQKLKNPLIRQGVTWRYEQQGEILETKVTLVGDPRTGMVSVEPTNMGVPHWPSLRYETILGKEDFFAHKHEYKEFRSRFASLRGVSNY
jgi:hypothetical protein